MRLKSQWESKLEEMIGDLAEVAHQAYENDDGSGWDELSSDEQEAWLGVARDVSHEAIRRLVK